MSLTSTPVAIKTDRAGVIKITYHAAANPQPTTGSDTLTAADAATAPKVTATDTYTYTAVSVGVASFSFTPSPVATKHTLAANKIVALSVTAKSSLGVAVPRANVWLSFVQASGGGSAYAHGLQLTSSPQVFKTDASGVIKVTYATGFTLPTTGTDTIKIANAMAGATATGTDITASNQDSRGPLSQSGAPSTDWPRSTRRSCAHPGPRQVRSNGRRQACGAMS